MHFNPGSVADKTVSFILKLDGQNDGSAVAIKSFDGPENVKRLSNGIVESTLKKDLRVTVVKLSGDKDKFVFIIDRTEFRLTRTVPARGSIAGLPLAVKQSVTAVRGFASGQTVILPLPIFSGENRHSTLTLTRES